MKIKQILWLEDQFLDFNTYKSPLTRTGCKIDFVRSVSEAEKKLREEAGGKIIYDAYIFDIKVLPGNDQEWLRLDEKIRKEKPGFDSYLGLELMRALFLSERRKKNIDFHDKLRLTPDKVIVFSVVPINEDVRQELLSFNIPRNQVVLKGESDLITLPTLVEYITGG